MDRWLIPRRFNWRNSTGEVYSIKWTDTMTMDSVREGRMDWGVSYRGIARQNRSMAGIWAGSISNTIQHVVAVLITLCYKLKDISRAGPRHVDTSGRLIIWLPRQANNFVSLKTSNFFWLRTELVNLSEGSCSNCGQFWKKLFCIWKLEVTAIIFVITPAMSFTTTMFVIIPVMP